MQRKYGAPAKNGRALIPVNGILAGKLWFSEKIFEVVKYPPSLIPRVHKIEHIGGIWSYCVTINFLSWVQEYEKKSGWARFIAFAFGNGCIFLLAKNGMCLLQQSRLYLAQADICRGDMALVYLGVIFTVASIVSKAAQLSHICDVLPGNVHRMHSASQDADMLESRFIFISLRNSWDMCVACLSTTYACSRDSGPARRDKQQWLHVGLATRMEVIGLEIFLVHMTLAGMHWTRHHTHRMSTWSIRRHNVKEKSFVDCASYCTHRSKSLTARLTKRFSTAARGPIGSLCMRSLLPRKPPFPSKERYL